MISKTIKYEDFNGNEVKKTFHFHISKADLAELNYKRDGGSISEDLATITQDNTGVREVLDVLKEIVLAAVGIKSEDGTRFVKSDEARSALIDTDAYSELLFEMIDNPEYAAEFIRGVLPKSVQKELQKELGGRELKDLSREELIARFEGIRNNEADVESDIETE